MLYLPLLHRRRQSGELGLIAQRNGRAVRVAHIHAQHLLAAIREVAPPQEQEILDALGELPVTEGYLDAVRQQQLELPRSRPPRAPRA
jgi:hypothetical protein